MITQSVYKLSNNISINNMGDIKNNKSVKKTATHLTCVLSNSNY